MQWFRSHHGAPFDTKLALVAKRANVTRGHAASLWWAVLDYASQSEPRGSVSGIDAEEIAAAFDYEEEEVSRMLEAMRHKETLIDADDMLTGWNKRQVQREDGTAAERKQRQRSRSKDDTSRDVTQRHAPEKIREDTDKKKEDANASSGEREFVVWYSEFPNKVGKAHALKAFKTARKKADLETLLTGLRRYVSNKPADRQWCNPATWLNGERWLDHEAAPAVNQAAAEDEVDRMILEAAREADRRDDQHQRTDHGAVEPLELGFRPADGEDCQRRAQPEVRRAGGGLRGISSALPAVGAGGGG